MDWIDSNSIENEVEEKEIKFKKENKKKEKKNKRMNEKRLINLLNQFNMIYVLWKSVYPAQP